MSSGLNLHTCGGSGLNMSANTCEAYFFPVEIFKIILASDRKKSVICRFCESKRQPRQSFLILTFSNLPSRLQATSWGQYVWKDVFALEPHVIPSTHGRASRRGAATGSYLSLQLRCSRSNQPSPPNKPPTPLKDVIHGGKRSPVSKDSVCHNHSREELKQTTSWTTAILVVFM